MARRTMNCWKLPWPSCTSTDVVPAAAAMHGTHSLLHRWHCSALPSLVTDGTRRGSGALTSRAVEVCERHNWRLLQATPRRGRGRRGRLLGGRAGRDLMEGQGNQEGARGQAAGRPGAVGQRGRAPGRRP